MMRTILASISVLLALCSPAVAQSPADEIAALRSQLAAARIQFEATQSALEGRLNALEAGSASRAPATPATPGDAPAPVGTGPTNAEGTAGQEREARFGSFDLIAGPAGGRAAFALSRTLDHGGPGDADALTAFQDTTSLTFSAPLSNGDDSPFATLDGLTSGTKLEFEFTRAMSRILTPAGDSRSPILRRARERCGRVEPAYKPNCTDIDEAFLTRFFEGGERAQYEREYTRDTLQRSWAWSLRGAVGYDELNYYPLPTLAKTTDEEVSGSVGGGLTIFPFYRASASLDLDYQRSYAARTAVTTCPLPAGGATSVSCVPGPLLGPELTDRLILAPELRYVFPIEGNPLVRALGFGPRIEFDLLSSDVAFDLPVYFASDEDDGLTGGVRFGYTTDDDEFKFGIFVGKAFSIFR